MISTHVAAILHLRDVNESVTKNHVVREQLICLDAAFRVAITFALARVDACRSALEVSTCVLHVLAVMHHLNETIHVCARLLMRMNALDSAHHCLRPPRSARHRVRACGTQIHAGKILSVFLAGCELLFEPVRQSLLVSFRIVASFFAAMIMIRVTPFTKSVIPAFVTVLVIPACRSLLDGTVTARIKMRTNGNVAA